MKISDLETIIHTYSTQYINAEELMYLQIVEKLKKWNLMNDLEKQQNRKEYIKMKDVHFYYEKNLEYEKALVSLVDSILNLKGEKQRLYKKNVFFFRIINLLYCEKELALYPISIKNVKGHVPFEIFEPLIEKVKDTQEYKQYRLDELFEEYKKMYQLFLEKPYE